jgi:hypothetical protein
MFGAERDHTLAMLGGEDDVAGDEDQLFNFQMPLQKNILLSFLLHAVLEPPR